MKIVIDEKTKLAIEKAISDGEKVEITQTKSGLMIFAVRRKKIAEVNREPLSE